MTDRNWICKLQRLGAVLEEQCESRSPESKYTAALYIDCSMVQIAHLIADRDEARRMVCRQHVDLFIREEFDELGLDEAASIVAKEMNWDCFKEDGK